MTVPGFRRAVFAQPLILFLVALLIRPASLRANDVTPPVAPPPRPPIIGFVDTHLHQFANLGFGGLEVFGSPVDPALDPNADPDVARARALPDSDFVYVSQADAANYRYIAGVAATSTPLAESCDDGSCWPQCPAGTGVSGNACVKISIHGNNGADDLLNKIIPNGSDSHGTLGYPDMNGWPAFDVLTAQQAYWEWLKRAHEHGMKLMVMLAVNNSVLCQLAMHLNSFGCGDDGSVSRQIQGAKDLETYIDAREGGDGFYRIVYNSDEARAAIAAGKLAVVLGTEVDSMWGCTPGAAGCTASYVQDRVQDYYDMGIRVVYPVHLIDNQFGGTAPYNGLFEVAGYLTHGNWYDLVACGSPIEWRSDVRKTISDAKTGVEVALGFIVLLGPGALLGIELAVDILIATTGMLTLMLPLLGAVLPGLGPILGIGGSLAVAAAAIFIMTLPGQVDPTDQGNCNNRGLTSVGDALVNALMDHHMIIDADHTDQKTFDAILDIAESRKYPGIVVGHTGLISTYKTAADLGDAFDATESGRHEANKTNAQIQRVTNVGGFVSLGLIAGDRKQLREFSDSDGIAFDCGRSSQAFAQEYLYATKTLGLTAVGFGSDLNGFPGSVAPRYGVKACKGDHPLVYDAFGPGGRLIYGTATDYFGNLLPQYTFGNRTYDFNVDGFAHAGMYPDFIADLRAIGVSQSDLAPMFNGAEAYVRMWEKIDDDEAPTVRCGTVGDDWHAADVTVPCLAFDFGWGLQNGADANFSLSTNLPDGMETDNAATGTHAAICDHEPNCTGTIGPIAGINVDKKDPVVSVTTPAAGLPTYTLNQVVPASYFCTDGGSGVNHCDGTVPSGANVNTTSVGTFGFTVDGADNVGHEVTVEHPYTVSFAICPTYDQTAAHRANSTVPIRFMLCDANGVNVSLESIVVTATGTVLLSTSAPGPLQDSGNANPDNQFRFAGGEYIFNLKTTGLATGTWALTFTATGDPNPHQVLFQIR